MNSKQVRFPIMIVAALFIGIYLFLAAQSAEAAGSPWATWKLETTFPNNNIETMLIVQIGHTSPSGHRIIDKEQYFPVSCQAVGNPVIKSGTATFDGSSYFQCSVPSIKEKVATMTSNSLIIPDVCASTRRPYIAGEMAIEANPVNPKANNPIFYLENNLGQEEISLAIPLDVSAQQATLDVVFSQKAASSDSFALNSGYMQAITAVYARFGPSAFAPTFEVDNTSLAATPAVINGALRFSTLENTAFIGYSPATGEYFEGTIQSLIPDPHCEGKG